MDRMHPPEVNVVHVAKACKIGVDRLVALSQDHDQLFHAREKRCAKGKVRLIDPPTPLGKRLLRALNRFLQRVVPLSPVVHGGALSRSCVTSAAQHCGNNVFVVRDIHQCYPSITHEMMTSALGRLGFHSDVVSLLADLLVIRGCVAQGSPASGSALNIVMNEFDHQLAEWARDRGFKASRTYDDIVVSSSRREDLAEIAAFLDAGLASAGFQHSRRKAKKRGVQFRDSAKSCAPRVHNLLVSRPGGVGLAPEHREEALVIARRYKLGCASISMGSIEALAKTRQRAMGWMQYASQVRYGPYKNIKQLIQSGDRIAHTRLASHGLPIARHPWYYVQSGVNEPKRLAGAWRKIYLSAGASS